MTATLLKNIEIISGKYIELKEKFGVKKIGIFGSFARDEQKKTSDIDILVELEKPIGIFQFLDLEEYLSKLLKRKVDLTTKKAIKKIIKKAVLKETIYV